MLEYIERKEIKRAVQDLRVELDAAAVQRVIEAVDHMPATDVAPVVHGRWIRKRNIWKSIWRRGKYIDICSCCKNRIKLVSEQLNFCPYCGSKMDLDGQHETPAARKWIMRDNMKHLKEFFCQLFCKHSQVNLLRWHWTHGPAGNDPAFVEVEYRCKACGKIFCLYLYGQEAHEWAWVMGDFLKE